MADTAVIICTDGRPHVLHATIENILGQSHLPAEILVVIYDTSAVLPETEHLSLVTIVRSARGLCTQRNTGAAAVKQDVKYLLFMDDDMELMSNFIESQEELFQTHPDVVLSSAATIANGAGTGALSREQAKIAVASYQPRDVIEYHGGAYGCNMYVRRTALISARFDENLPLYAMMEDHDFSAQCVRLGNAAWNFRTGIAHLAASSGRINDPQVGYSQFANPYYLWRKGSISFRFCFWNCWTRFLIANLARAFLPLADRTFSPAARLKGNLLAFGDFLRRRLIPSNILGM